MKSPSGSARLVLITGPIAAGKSTLAGLVAERLRDTGCSVAEAGLDEVAEMALPTLDWVWAHDVHASLVRAWLQTSVDVVVAEGTETPAEVAVVMAAVPAEVAVLHVVLVADFVASLCRAQRDSGRGLSKDPAFLRGMHDRFQRGLPQLAGDLVLDVESAAPSLLAQQVMAALSR